MIRQRLPKRPTTQDDCAYANSKKLEEDFFTDAKRKKRTKLLKNKMSFLHRLIADKLKASHYHQLHPELDPAEGTLSSDSEAEDTPETQEAAKDKPFWKSKDDAVNLKIRLKNVSDLVC